MTQVDGDDAIGGFLFLVDNSTKVRIRMMLSKRYNSPNFLVHLEGQKLSSL